MQIIILATALVLLASSFAFLAIYIEDRAMKKGVEEFPLLNDQEFEALWQQAEGNEQEFQRLAQFEQKIKMVETEYSFSLSVDPRAHRRMAILFSTWGKQWDREHGIED